MSALLGLCRFDGAPVEPGDLEAMRAALAHRGPDGSSLLDRGAAGLGHLLLATTPARQRERLPLEDGSRRRLLTMDARIDNREELAERLGLAGDVGDGALVLAAYEKWGAEFPREILGDFAIALWDGRARRLVCARDTAGAKSLYYHRSPHVLAFATELKALHALSWIPRRLNEVRVGDYFASVFDDVDSTFFEEIMRLPAAHRLVAEGTGLRVERYWEPDPGRELRLGSDEEYAEGFRDRFEEAVRCRLQGDATVGALLSGGLDSSAIVCMARALRDRDADPLPTYSAVFDDVPQSDERRFIEHVTAGGGLDPTYVRGDREDPLGHAGRMLEHHDEPFQAFNAYLTWPLYAAAAERGVRVLLDGFDGDTTISHGAGYLAQLARDGRWWSLARELRGYARHTDTSAWKLMRGYARRHSPLYRRAARRLARRRQEPARPMFDAAFLARTNLAERHRQFKRPVPTTEREEHFRLLTWGVMPQVLEVVDRASAAFGVESRFPFWDRRLVEYCLSLPPRQKIRDGLTRFVARQALADLLPPAIRQRGGKTDLGHNFLYTFRRFEAGRVQRELVDGGAWLGRFLDPEFLQAAAARWLAGESREKDAALLWRALLLGRWLRRALPDEWES